MVAQPAVRNVCMIRPIATSIMTLSRPPVGIVPIVGYSEAPCSLDLKLKQELIDAILFSIYATLSPMKGRRFRLHPKFMYWEAQISNKMMQAEPPKADSASSFLVDLS
jgi:hypothetical protein